MAKTAGTARFYAAGAWRRLFARGCLMRQKQGRGDYLWRLYRNFTSVLINGFFCGSLVFSIHLCTRFPVPFRPLHFTSYGLCEKRRGATAVVCVADGRRTQGMTAVVRTADGRRTITFSKQTSAQYETAVALRQKNDNSVTPSCSEVNKILCSLQQNNAFLKILRGLF